METRYPATLHEAYAYILTHSDAEELAYLRATPRAELARRHAAFALQLRNSLGLAGENAALLAELAEGDNDLFGIDPGALALFILEGFWESLQNQGISEPPRE